MPKGRIKNDVPNVRTQPGAILTPGIDIDVQAGTPIGLLLALTYANDFTVFENATFKGVSPTARIRNE